MRKKWVEYEEDMTKQREKDKKKIARRLEQMRRMKGEDKEEMRKQRQNHKMKRV